MAQPGAQQQRSPQSLYAKAAKSAQEQPVQSDFLREMLMKEKALAQQRESAMQQELAEQEAQESDGGMGDLPWDQTEDYYDEEDGEVGGGSADDDVKPMPKQFYSDVDSFLKAAPPPSLKGVSGSKKRGEIEASVNIMRQAAKPERGRVIRKALPSSGGGAPVTLAPRVASRVDTGRTKSNSGHGSQKRSGSGAGASSSSSAARDMGGPNRAQGPLDVSLLQEAFQYTQQLVQQAGDEDLEEAAGGAMPIPGVPTGGVGVGAGPGAGGARRAVEGNNNGDAAEGRSGGKGANKPKAHPSSAPSARSETGGRGSTGGRGGSGPRNGGALSAGSSGNAVNKRVTSNLAKKLRGQAAAYSDADRPPGSGGPSGRPAGVGKGKANKASRDTLAGRAEHSSSFSTSRTSQDDSGGVGSGGLKSKLDYAALVANFESGNTLKRLQEDLQRSQDSAQQSAAFTRKAMMEANFQQR